MITWLILFTGLNTVMVFFILWLLKSLMAAVRTNQAVIKELCELRKQLEELNEI